MKPEKPEIWRCPYCDFRRKIGPGLARAKRDHFIRCEHGRSCVVQPCLWCENASGACDQARPERNANG